MTNAPGDPRHLPALDGLRGLAAAAVVLSHLPKFGLATVGEKHLGHYGVMIFFVLSGFLMGHLYLSRRFTPREVARYSAARIARIAPIYYLTVLASFAIYQAVDPGFVFRIEPYDLLRLLLFVGNVGIFWSIGPEFQFYALFLLLWWAAATPGTARIRRLAGLGAATLLVFFVQSRFPGILVFSKLHIFLLGVGAALLAHRIGPRLGARLTLALQVAAVAFLLCLLLPRGVFGEVIYTAAKPDLEFNIYFADLRRLAPVALAVFALALPSRWTRLVFANAALRALGAASFSVYLLHEPVLYALVAAGLVDAVGRQAGAVVGLLAVAAVATISFRLIERPLQDLLRAPLAERFETWLGGLPRGRARAQEAE